MGGGSAAALLWVEQGPGWVQFAGSGPQALCALLVSWLAVPVALSLLVWGACTLGSAYLYSLSSVKMGTGE